MTVEFERVPEFEEEESEEREIKRLKWILLRVIASVEKKLRKSCLGFTR
ncbi:MAG: hypothetical protein QXR60_02735 [Candidatus Nanoarchaeia archaeon]